MQNTSLGSYIAIAGIIASFLTLFNIIIPASQIDIIITGAVTLYGIIHQLVVSRKVTQLAIQAGVQGIK